MTDGFPVAGFLPVGGSALPTFGMNPAASIGWRRGLNNMLNGVRPARILCIGDSITRGFGQGNDSVGWPADLSGVLTGRGFSTAKGLCCPEFSRGAQTADPRISYGAGWSVTHSNHVWWGGVGPYWTANAGAGGVLTFTPSTLCNTFDVYYWSIAGLGGMTVTATGTAGTVVNTATTPGTGIGKVTVSCASNASNNTVTVGTITTAAVAIIGVEAYEAPAGAGTPAPQVLIGNAGVNGSLAFGWNDTTNPTYGPAAAITAYNADLNIVWLGPNDFANGQTVQQAAANVLAIGQAAQANGSSIWCVSNLPCQSTLAEYPFYPGMRTALLNEAAAQSWPLVDMFTRWGGNNGYATLNPLGWYFDGVHPDQIGYWDVATTFATALMNF